MSLDVWLTFEGNSVFEGNLTHNLNRMAEEAGLYYAIWRPCEVGANRAFDIAPSLIDGLRFMKRNRDFLVRFNHENGYGCFDDLERFVESYLVSCLVWPDAKISVHR